LSTTISPTSSAIRGQSADERQAQRQQHAVLLLAELHAWMIEQRPLNPLRKLNDKSPNSQKEL